MKQMGFVFALFAISLLACHSERAKNIPDVSHIQVDVDIQRFEQDLFEMDTTAPITGELEQLYDKYPVIAPFYFDELLGFGKIRQDTQNYYRAISELIRFPAMRHLYDTVQQIYPTLDREELLLEDAFRYYQHYFPGMPVPEVYSIISEYSVGTFTYGNEILVLGLDFFLGKDYPYYDVKIFPEFIQRSMTREHLAPLAIKALASNLVPPPRTEKLIDQMMYNGKILYITGQLMPHTPDSLIMAYSANEIEWCRNNELAIWAHLLNEDLLYSSEMDKISKLVNHSPNSPGMPPEAPGRTANWLAWQIIRQFMDRNDGATLVELIRFDDSQQLLEASKYKPQR